jgi:hypothetical protein
MKPDDDLSDADRGEDQATQNKFSLTYFRKISHSSIWDVTEEGLHKPGKASDCRRVGDCEIYFYNA